jgi:hypothetical protein
MQGSERNGIINNFLLKIGKKFSFSNDMNNKIKDILSYIMKNT